MIRKYQKKYGFIDSNGFRRMDYDVKREFAFNDFENVYYQKGFETIDQIFEKNNVDEKYRKVILEFDRINLRSGTEEIFTRIPFLVRKCAFGEDGRNILQGCSEATDVTNWMDFSDEVMLTDYSSVLHFISDMVSDDQLNAYMKSLLEFFRVKMRIRDKAPQYSKTIDFRNKKD